MGGALLSGLIAKQQLTMFDISIVEQEANIAKLRTQYSGQHFSYYSSAREISIKPDIILFAVKPQIIDTIITDYKKFAESSLIISIIAGKKINYFEKMLGRNTAIIRSMPNLAAINQHAITGFLANNNVTEKQQQLAQLLFETVGKVVLLKSEDEFDLMTAISASGPAYLFLLAETMIKAGEQLGMTNEMATMLVKWTIFGSALLFYESTENADNLRKQVTSPAGTTQAALNILMQDNIMQKLMTKAIENAANRSKELSHN
jgi:pyrroline-5-carboxylate reductase